MKTELITKFCRLSPSTIRLIKHRVIDESERHGCRVTEADIIESALLAYLVPNPPSELPLPANPISKMEVFQAPKPVRVKRERLNKLLQDVDAQDFAKQINASTAAVYKWAKGKAVPHPRTRIKIAEAFGRNLKQIDFTPYGVSA